MENNHYLVTLHTSLISTIIEYTFPLCVIVTLTLVVVSEPLVLFWVGNDYSDSIVIVQILIVGTGFGFVTNTASFYFTAKTKYSYIYTLAFILSFGL